MTDKLKEAIAALKSGDRETGQTILVDILNADDRNEQAWLWLTQTTDDKAEQIEILEKVIEINPDNLHAKKGLAQLRPAQAPAPKKLKRLPKKSTPADTPPPTSSTKATSTPLKENTSKKYLIYGGVALGVFLLACVLCLVTSLFLGGPDDAPVVAEVPEQVPEQTTEQEVVTEPPPPAQSVGVTDEIDAAYKNIITLDAVAEALRQTAEKRINGEIDGNDVLATVIILNPILDRLNANFISGNVENENLQKLIEIDKDTPATLKSIITRWGDGEITRERALEMFTSIREGTQESVRLAEQILAQDYGLSQESLSATREEFTNEFTEAFNTAGDQQSETSSPAPLPTVNSTFDPITLSGVGDSVVNIDKPDVPALAAIVGNNEGGAHFAVNNLDANGEELDLLVNTTDPYSGVVLFDLLKNEYTTRFQVIAEGEWSIRVLPIAAADELSVPGRFEGEGDNVIRLTGSDPDIATFTGNQNSEGLFAIIAYFGDDRDLLVNTTDPYQGQVVVPSNTFLLEVRADGPWAIDITPR